MKIAFIITDLSIGGAEIMLYKLLQHLDRNRFTPSVISLIGLGEIGTRISSLGITVYSLGMRTGRRNIFYLFFRLAFLLRQLRPDVVHTWLYHSDLLGGLAARLVGIRFVIWGIRSSNLNTDKTNWTTRAVRKLCATLSHVIPDRIFINSEAARKIHIDLGYASEKIHFLPNGFDVSIFRPEDDARIRLRAELGCTSDALLVGMFGRYDPLKNHSGFFKAMSLVHSQLPAVQIILAGKYIDSNNDELMRLIEEAGLNENTHLLGPREDMPQLMAGLDLLTCPSHAEAFPNVVGEAMASATPCVATDVGDCAFIIGETGRVVPPGDMVMFAASVVAMLKLSRAQRSSLGEKARARITSQFGIGGVVRQYEKSYELTRKKVQ